MGGTSGRIPGQNLAFFLDGLLRFFAHLARFGRFAIAIGGAMQLVIDAGERGMRFGELREALDQLFEFLARFIGLSLRYVNRRALIERAGIVRAHLKRFRDVR